VVAAENRSDSSAYDDDSRRLRKIPPAFRVISLHPRLASVLGGDDAAYMANATCSNNGPEEGWW
jgi:hypothetical protein